MNIIKNCTEIWSQLFDHKPFTQSELNSFVKEFEENRLDREIVTLLDSLNIECGINDQCDKINSLNDSVLKSLNDKVKRCLLHCDKILKNTKAEEEKNVLELQRKQRNVEWKKFTASMEAKYIDVDIQFKKELEEVKTQYENKENQLKYK